MRGFVFAIFSVIAISLADAHYLGKPRVEVFEIRENQLSKKLQIEPVKLQYDLESREKGKESQSLILSKLLQQKQKKKSNDLLGAILKRLEALKEQAAAKAKNKEPLVVVLSANDLDDSHSHYHSDEVSSLLFKPRNDDVLKPGSEVVFNIVPPRKPRKTLKDRRARVPAILRSNDWDDIVDVDDRRY